MNLIQIDNFIKSSQTFITYFEFNQTNFYKLNIINFFLNVNSTIKHFDES